MLFLGSLLSIVVECKSNCTSQRDIVAAFIQSLDSDYPDYDNEMSTNLAGGKKNPGEGVMKVLSYLSPEGYPRLITYFSRMIIPLIRENDRITVAKAIVLLINDDLGINDETVVEVISETKKKELSINPDELASFLAGVFLYTLKNTSNRQKRGLAKKLAKQYVKRAREEKLPTHDNDDVKALQQKTVDHSSVRLFKGERFSSAGVAILLEEWDESNNFDIALIEMLTGTKSMDIYEDLRSQDLIDITCENGLVTCSFASSLRDEMATNIDESHIRFLFSSVFTSISAASILDVMDGRTMNNACDFLSYLGCNIGVSSRIDRNRWDSLIFDFLKTAFSEQRSLECVMKRLPFLVEANPDIILDVVEFSVHDCKSVLYGQLKNNEKSDVVYALAYSLRKAAAYRKCFARAMSILFELSNGNSIFFDNMRSILVPQYIQTEAEIKNQLGIMRYCFSRDAEAAWKLLRNLLPGFSLTTLKRMNFKYCPVQFKEFSIGEYHQVLDEYVNLACTKIENRVDRAVDLVRICPLLSITSVNRIVNAVMEEISPSDNTGELLGLAQQYMSDFSFDEEKRTALSTLQKVYAENKEEVLAPEVFSLSNRKSRDNNAESKAIEYVLEVYERDGFSGLASFFGKVDDFSFYCDMVRKALTKEELRDLGCYLIEHDMKGEAGLLLSSISSSELLTLLDRNHPKYVDLLCAHTCDRFMMNYVQSLPSEMKNEYWGNVRHVDIKDFDSVRFKDLLDCLIECNNYKLIFLLVSLRIESEDVDIEQVVRILWRYDAETDCSGIYHDTATSCAILDIISYVEKTVPDRIDLLADIEGKYIRFFRPGSEQGLKNVWYKMASSPQYVERLVEHKQQKEQEGLFDSSESLLLYKFRTIPGTRLDGSFDFRDYCAWYEFATKSVLRDEMLKIFAENSYYAGMLQGDEFFMNRKVVEFVEQHFDNHLLSLFEIEALNSIGPIDLSTGLHAYDEFVKDFENKAECCEIEGYLKVSKVFRSLAKMLAQRT